MVHARSEEEGAVPSSERRRGEKEGEVGEEEVGRDGPKICETVREEEGEEERVGHVEEHFNVVQCFDFVLSDL